ncbi:MAG: hypothetical protein ACP5KS_02990 [Candidatus Hydrogenedens sp.]
MRLIGNIWGGDKLLIFFEEPWTDEIYDSFNGFEVIGKGHIKHNLAVDYEGDWKHFLIFDKKKLEELAVKTIKKNIYCLAQHGWKSDVYFPSTKQRDVYNYVLGTVIYNIPTKEAVKKIYDYVKEKDKEGIYYMLTVRKYEKYKYVAEISTDWDVLKISRKQIVDKNKIKTKLGEFVVGDNYRKGWGIYKYDEAVEKFGPYLENTFISKNDRQVYRVENKCYGFFDEIAEKYKTIMLGYTVKAIFVYIITDVPPNKIKSWAEEVKKHTDRYMEPDTLTEIMDETTLKVMFPRYIDESFSDEVEFAEKYISK